MSLILNDLSHASSSLLEDGTVEDQRDLIQLDRYLAIIETNKKSCRFVPNDALMALDMAGFVRDRLAGAQTGTKVTAARLALSLVQPCKVPVQ